MNKLAIVYWSGTGNTETMANCIADGARESGAEVAMLPPGEFSAARFSEFGVVAFGCPAMGAEQLEEDEVEPMFAGLEGSLGGRRSPCSAPTAGATASGCGSGAAAARRRAPTCMTKRADRQ